MCVLIQIAIVIPIAVCLCSFVFLLICVVLGYCGVSDVSACTCIVINTGRLNVFMLGGMV